MNPISFFVETPYNPIPYKRTTQRAKYSDEYKRYQSYKNLVISQFIRKTGKHPHNVLKSSNKYRIDVFITYCDKRHGDSDNIAKGINDALFKNDKLVAGSYDFAYGETGRVDIEIREVEL